MGHGMLYSMTAMEPPSLPRLVLVLLALLLLSFLARRSRPSRSPTTPPKPSLGATSTIKHEDASNPGRPAIEPLNDLDWASTSPAVFRPFKPVYHITMAIQATTPSELIAVDRNYLDRVTSRRRLISVHGPAVAGLLPTARAARAVGDLYAYLLGHYLPRRFPSMFELVATAPPEDERPWPPPSPPDLRENQEKQTTKAVLFHNKVARRRFPLNPPPADPLEMLRILGETVEDDLFLLLRDPPDDDDNNNDAAAHDDSSSNNNKNNHGSSGQHRAVAFVCCHPSGFDPSEKLGKRLVDIHGPVPGYEKIQASMERFFGRLEVGRPVKRVNWGIQTHPDLHAPASHRAAPREPSSPATSESEEPQGQAKENAAKTEPDLDVRNSHLRVELQTVTRLPRSGSNDDDKGLGHDNSGQGPILFSFKTHLYPLTALRAEGHGPALADAIEGLRHGNAPGMWEYKGAERWGRGLCEFLRSSA
ncbi:hypothetical protein VTJ83DRAFT_3077 [Remersonia thermophila]|uniref:Uncharacterized protein n=1 Tax=Remersonia thermophila TaxID=72144 RepID=A0ABR4DD18_9PEZI